MCRNGREEFKDFDLAAFAKKTFGMFGGTDTEVTLVCDKSMAGVLIDRFGKSIRIVPEENGRIHVRVTVAVSPQFFGWVTSLGKNMEIAAPEYIRKEYRAFLDGIRDLYE